MASHSIKEQALRVMRLVGAASCRCPAHSQAFAPGLRPESSAAKEHVEPEYAFEVASSTIRYGQGVTREVGMDFKNHGLKKVCVVTDQKVASLPPVKEAIQSLEGNGIKYELYDKVRIEPTDTSFKDAITWPVPYLNPRLFLLQSAGIANRAIRPMLGIVDPLHTLHMSPRLTANSGYDVLCTAVEFINRSIEDSSDLEARSNMHLASVYAGVGFGNAGVHLCHGMSYPISGLVKSYRAQDYDVQHSLVPHGLSVVMTSPAVFRFTAPACPDRHLEAAKILGADTTNVKLADAGMLLSDTLRDFMYSTGVDNGLKALGYTTDDIPALVKGTLPQHRVTKLAPAGNPGEEELARLFEESMTVY
ncbi:PREDICTED: hydroxyacid-oxoacid transhydrogenase, mitochondrial-like [Acropora digitifera]|uniref:hydroxyacid-oxoacid transhydrogenase, mitochondrial-like n=1 Tax=Acropora digitifera TaxID=70779 RepID=UPI00077B1B81|nr:PREDICTED: hydroxyacid-oxoacid transhydrogenase, mitochondrial-like [Acropora digitifera]